MSHHQRIIVLSVTVAVAGWAAACGGDGDATNPLTESPNQTPTAVGSIPAQMVTAGETVSLDVASFFNDPDGDALTYTAATSSPGIASPTMSGSTLTIAGVAAGTASVTVTARDPGGLTATQGTAVTVERPNEAPMAVGSIPAQTIEVGDEVTENMADYFSDPDGDALTYEASTSDSGIASTRLSGSLVTIAGVAEGTATLTVTATDPGGLTATQSTTVTVEEASRDREALVALYIGTDGVGWSNNSGWLSEGALGSWYGVTADDADRVTELNLPRNRLDSEIPPELGLLKKLIRLDLSDNRMEGRIPRELGNLENLEWLDLSGSLFFAYGTFPRELGNLRKLKWLDLSETIFFGTEGGPIPAEWGNLESLERLDLRSAGITEKLPAQLGNLENLKWLDITYNVLAGEIPREFMKLTLERFHWKVTQSLCAPADAEFQAWLSSIPDHNPGRTCAS